MTIQTQHAFASYRGTGTVYVYATGEYKTEQEVPVNEPWIHEHYAIEVGARHPSFPGRLCRYKKADRHAFGFWQLEAEFHVERYVFDNDKMESVFVEGCDGEHVFQNWYCKDFNK